MENERFDGMTLNERLFSAGLIESFELAANQRDRHAIGAILRQVAVEDVEWTVDAILAAPHRNGS